MSIVQHKKLLDAQLANLAITNGSTIYTTDTGKHFIDISDTERVQITDIIYIDTDSARAALLAPLPDKLYITRDTNKVWIYSVKTDKWVCLNTDTTYSAGTGISISGTTINNSGVRAVTAGASANKINVNTNGNTNTITINNVANATSAGKATNDSAGQQINTTYIKGLSVSGKVITYTKGDGTTDTITTQDTNTWRGIQNVLTSDSTTESLSAAQGKVLKGLVDGKADKATTLDGYGITDAKISGGVITLGSNTITPLTSHQSLTAYAKTADVNTALNKKADKATTLAGYGITDASISNGIITIGSNTITPLTSHQSLAAYAKTADMNTALAKKADKATTLAGYGIADAKIANGTITLGANTITPLTSHQSLAAYAKTADMNTALGKKADKATTLAGYGIADAKISGGVITLGANTITPLTSHQSLSNYYTKGKVDELINNLKAGLVNVVESLPTTGEKGILYLVKTGSESENVYTEYIYVNEAWEKLGTQKLDLSGYLTKTDAANTYLGKTAAAASANKLNTNAGSATQPVYFSNGVPVATTYTLGKSVPSNAVFTDTNNKVTQSAVTDADYTNYRPLVWGASNSSTKDFTPSTVTDGVFTSKGLYVQPSTGLIHATTFEGNLAGTASNAAKVNNLTVLTAVPANAKFTDTVYTHPATHPASMITGLATVATSGKYSDLSGAPTSLPANGGTATKLSTDAGSATQPVYFANGIPVATTYTLGKSVPSDAKFTDTVYTLPDATTSVKGGIKVGSNLSISSGTLSLTKANVTAALGYTPPTTNTTYSDMKAATADAAGAHGLVPSPAAGKQLSFLRGDGTWVVPTDTKYTHPSSHPASMITGLAAVATSGSYNDLTNKPTIPAAYSLPDATTSVKGGVKVGSNLTVSSGTLSLTKANVTGALGYTPPTHDTHYATGLKVGASATATANAAATNGNVFLNVLDNTTVRDSHNIVGSGATTVTSDANGKITISSTNTVYTHPSSHPASMITGLAKVATSGSYADLSNKPTIPTSLPANGGTATKALQDGNGNNIVSTYRTKNDSYSLADTRRLFECMVPYGTNIPENANLNTATYLKIGNYYCNLSATAASMTNCPTNEAFMMRVYSPLSTTIDNESSSTWVYRLREIITLSGTTYRQYVSSGSTAGSFSYNSWKQVAFTSDIPTKLPANGGNATTVNGHTVNSDVPAGAKFTDTIYTLPDATTSVKGGVKVGSNISVSSGTISLTKANVVAALGYTPPTTDTNTDTKVTNTLATTTKAYVTGTTGATTNTGTQVFDTGVYLDTTAGTLVATKFKTSTGIEIY